MEEGTRRHGGEPRSATRGGAAAVLLAATGLLVAAAGGVTVALALKDRVVREATLGGLYLRLNLARWLVDQMEHNQGFPMPQSMMPDIPPHGQERLSVELILHNPTEEPLSFGLDELCLCSDHGGVWPSREDELPMRITLAPGLSLNRVATFDYFDETGEETALRSGLRLVWRRDGRTVAFPVPHPPSHDHDEEEPAEPVEWPESVDDLPPGDAGAGWFLYSTKLSCVSCHGHPDVPGTNTVGPRLGRIGLEGSNRVLGQTAAQYLYESIIDPNAFIAPVCANGEPCADPSIMPVFPALTLKEAADLVAYLLEQREND